MFSIKEFLAIFIAVVCISNVCVFAQEDVLPEPINLSQLVDLIVEEHLIDTVDDETSNHTLPSVSEVLNQYAPIQNFSFACSVRSGRHYGYYADMETNCKYFHVCTTVSPEPGTATPTLVQFYFQCPEETVFDQKTTACVDKEKAIPCEKSEEFFYRNTEYENDETDGPIEDKDM